METKSIKTMLKKLMSILLILVMLSSYCPMFVFAAEEENEIETNEEFITLDVNWDNPKGKSLEGKTENSYGFSYNLKFNGIYEFKNVKMIVKDDGTIPPAQITLYDVSEGEIKNNKGTYAVVDFGTKNTGIEFEGSGSIKFASNDIAYSKKIQIELTAQYLDITKKEIVEKTITDTIEANITPKTQEVKFDGLIRMQLDRYDRSLDVGISKSTKNMYNNENKYVGWYLDKVITRYPIHIDSYKYTQELNLAVTIDRKVDGVSKLSTGYTIDWDGLNTTLGEPTKQDNADGSVTYLFKRGEYSQTLVKENTFEVKKDYEVKITYTIPNTNPEQGGTIQETATNCFFTAELETNGFETKKEYGQAEVVTPVTRNSALNKNSYVALAEYTPGKHAWVGIEFYTKGSSYLLEEDIKNLKENGSIDLSFYTDIDNGANRGDKEECTSGVHYSAPEITYLSDEGKIVTLKLTENQIRLKSITEDATVSADSFIKYNNTNVDF